jgi:hypothetical protein
MALRILRLAVERYSLFHFAFVKGISSFVALGHFLFPFVKV